MKIWWLALIPFVAAFAGLGFWVGGAQSTPKVVNLAEEARGVFKAKCAGCHGPDLPKPKAQFGYVLDLRRLAADPEKVIPGRPAESELWALVEHDEMPPPGFAAWTAHGGSKGSHPELDCRRALPIHGRGAISRASISEPS